MSRILFIVAGGCKLSTTSADLQPVTDAGEIFIHARKNLFPLKPFYGSFFALEVGCAGAGA
jgi:hypothetical protein